MTPHRLKSLETEKAGLLSRLRRLSEQQRETKGELAKLNQRLESVNREIKECKIDPIVSEHAMLRYFERVLGFDLSEVESAILTDDVCSRIGRGEKDIALDKAIHLKVSSDGVITTLVCNDAA